MMLKLAGARIVVTGGAGFLGSHLLDALIDAGADVICIDNFSTGDERNIAHLFGNRQFTIHVHDVSNYIFVPGPVDAVLHLASPASPIDYLNMPIQTMKVGSLGTHNALGLAKSKSARFLLASTSEVYGDPQVHPQPETYWGHVNPIGQRGVYDEAKRFGEALAFAYHRIHQVDICVARIFNTYGPRMRMSDGRAIPTFIRQALANEPLSVHGDGTQTRSMTYIDDLVGGMIALLCSAETGPINLGSEEETSLRDIAEAVIDTVGSSSSIAYGPRPVDDPQSRRPDISLARNLLDWTPRVTLGDGLARTVAWYRRQAAPSG